MPRLHRCPTNRFTPSLNSLIADIYKIILRRAQEIPVVLNATVLTVCVSPRSSNTCTRRSYSPYRYQILYQSQNASFARIERYGVAPSCMRGKLVHVFYRVFLLVPHVTLHFPSPSRRKFIRLLFSIPHELVHFRVFKHLPTDRFPMFHQTSFPSPFSPFSSPCNR